MTSAVASVETEDRRRRAGHRAQSLDPRQAVGHGEAGPEPQAAARAELERPRPSAPEDDFLGKGRVGALDRGRHALAMDLKRPAAIQAVLGLLAHADCQIEGFRPGVMERLGLGPDACHARNPRLVYGRVTGWGQEGPLAHAPGHDINYIALTGMLHGIGP